jgi:hypothetical protein
MKDLHFASRARRRLERRLFLKALGLGLGAPLAYQLVRTATAAPTGAPQRFMLLYVPHGMPPEHFNPVGEGTDFTLADSGVSILGPLEPYKSLVNVYEGFKYPGADTHQGIVKFLSGTDVANSDDTTPRTTIEHFIGNEMGVGTLALGAVPHRVWGQDFDAKLLWDGQAVAPEPNPLLAYDDVFGGLGNGSEVPDTSVADELQNKLLTLTEGQITSLQGSVASLTTEHTKLQTHLESIQALKATIGGGTTTSCTTAPTLSAVEALRAKAVGQPAEWFLTEENFPDIFAAQLQIAAEAMVCNSRPVTAIQPLYANCEIDFTFAGLVDPGDPAPPSAAHHSGLSHTGPQVSGGVAEMGVRRPFAKAQRWFVEQLVEHVITRLDVDDPAAPGSTVLDNTIILLCSEIGEGQWHTSWTREILAGAPPGIMSYMPLVTIGGGAGRLVTGQRLNYYDVAKGEKTGDRPAADLLLTLAKAMGSSASSFGGSSSAITEALA